MFKRALLATAIVLATASAAHAQSVVLSENFNDITTLASSGWVLTNLSSPAGTTSWFQGNAGIFSAQSGAATSYIAANFNSAAAGGTIDNWLISPTFSTAAAGTVSFYLKGAVDAGFSDALKYGLGTSASSDTTTFTNLTTISTVGSAWTQYTVSFAAAGAGSVGRLAIEYFGPADTSNYIGIDCFSVSAVPETATWLAMAAGLAGVALIVRRKSA